MESNAFNGTPKKTRVSTPLLGFPRKPVFKKEYKGLFPFKEFTFNAIGIANTYNGASILDCQNAYNFAQNGVVTPAYGIGGGLSLPGRIRTYVSATPSTITIKFTTSAAFVASGFYFFTYTTSSGASETISIFDDATGQLLVSNTFTSSISPQMRFELYNFNSYRFVPGITYRITFTKSPYYALYDTNNGTTGVVKTSFSLPSPLVGTITTVSDTNTGLGNNFSVWGLYINEISALANANWINNSNYFTVGDINGYQLWTVPISGNYYIEAAGARGGPAKYAGALGARVFGTFYLTRGTKMWICVGQMGQDGNAGTSDLMGAGGGGGSFVVLADPNNPIDHTSLSTVPLLIAAGGQGSIEGRHAGPVPGIGSATTGLTDHGFSAAAYTYNKSIAGALQFRGNVASGGLTGQVTSYGVMSTAGGFGGGRSWDDSTGNAGGYTIPNPGGAADGTPTYSFTSPMAISPGGSDGVNYGSGYVFIQLQ